MGLLQFALGLSKFKGESPKDSYSAKPRENHVDFVFIYLLGLNSNKSNIEW